MTVVLRPKLAIGTALALLILLSLGVWQLQRRAWKLDLIASAEALSTQPAVDFSAFLAREEKREYTRVLLTGVMDAAQTAPVFGTLGPRAGVYLFVPLYAEAGDFKTYVNLGFVPQDAFERGDFSVPDSETAIVGLYRRAATATGIAGAFLPKTNDDGFWYIRQPTRFAEADGIEAAPDSLSYYFDNAITSGEDWPRGGTTRLDFTNRHLEYALTWFGLALTLIGVFIAYSVRRT